MLTRNAKREIIMNAVAQLNLKIITPTKKNHIPSWIIVIDKNNDMNAINALYTIVNNHNKTAESLDGIGWNPQYGASFKKNSFSKYATGSFNNDGIGYGIELG